MDFKHNLTDFAFKEILGGDTGRNALFLLLEKNDDAKTPAVLICNKEAFVEDATVISEWLHGAEVSLIDANDVYNNIELLLPSKFNRIKSMLIYPATPKHIAKYRRKPFHFIVETAEYYRNVTLAYIAESAMNHAWVYNLLDKKAEAERIVYEDEDRQIGFILAPDSKWNGTDVDSLYLQALVHRRDLRSVRDLTAKELPLLENIRDKCLAAIHEKWGLARSKLKFFFHYQPSYYHLHVHIINIKYDAPGLGDTAIHLHSAIENLRLFPDYYQRATLVFVRKEGDPLYQKYAEAGLV